MSAVKTRSINPNGGEVGLLELLTSGFCSMVKRQIMIKVAETLGS